MTTMNGYLKLLTKLHQTFVRSLLFSVGVFILALLLAVSQVSGASIPVSDAVLRIGNGVSNEYTIAPGQEVTVPVEVVGATDLGAATVLLSYDPAVVRVVACTGPVSADFGGGVCNASYALGVVKFNVISIDGVTGLHRLYDVTFEAVGGDTGATTTDLTLTVEHYADSVGNDLPVTTTGGRINVEGQPPVGDVILKVGDSNHQFDLPPGDSLVVPIMLDIGGSRPLGAASVLLRYDPQVLRPTQCARPAGVNDGMMGYCNPIYDPTGGLVKFNILSDSGLTGILHAWDVTFEVASGAASGDMSNLVLIVEQMTDLPGAPLPWQVINGNVLINDGSVNSAQVLVDAASEDGIYTVAQGGTTSISIWVTNVVDLGAATLVLNYDPTVVRALNCTIRTAGTGVTAGGCALYDDHIRANLISTGGIDGAVQLIDVVFTSDVGAVPGVTSPLTLTVEHFANTVALPLPSRTRDGRIDVTAGGGTSAALVRVGDGSNGGSFALPLDGEVTVQVGVQGAVGLGAATVSLQYNPANVRPVSCTTGDEVSFGYCNLWAGEGLIRMNAISQQGFNGDVLLFTLAFQAADGAVVNEQSALALDVTTFDDIYGESLLYETAPGMITITPAEGNVPQVLLQVGDGPYYLAVGERVTIPVLASVVTGNTLGVITLIVDYDPAVVQATSCTLNIDIAANGFDGGGCNLNYEVGKIKLNALSTTGVLGGTSIAWIEFEGIGAVEDSTLLELNVEHLADISAEPLKYQIETWSLAIAGADDDGDGAPGTVEMGAPQGGDGNGDGTADALQSHVASVPNIVDGRYITLVSPVGTNLIDVRATGNPSAATAPVGSAFPFGLLSFKVQGVALGSAVTVEVHLPEATVGTYYKYGPTPDNPTDHWYDFSYDGETGAQILSDHVVLHFVDGKRGDHDLIANREISDPGGMAETLFTASYDVSKVLVGHDSVRTSQNIAFTISVTNTGDVPLAEVSFSDHYDNTYLAFYSSDPPADDVVDDGVLNWSNLLAGALAPGASISVEVVFRAKADTTGLLVPQLPCQETGQTCNMAVADRVVFAPGSGQMPKSLGVQQAWDNIRIEQPTAVRIVGGGVDYVDGDVVLSWETVDESDIVGFNISRCVGAGEPVKITNYPLVAKWVGQSQGGRYVYVDESVRWGEGYQYHLEMITTGHSTWQLPLGSVVAQQVLYLPSMSN